jgi:ribosomal protein L21E
MDHYSRETPAPVLVGVGLTVTLLEFAVPQARGIVLERYRIDVRDPTAREHLTMTFRINGLQCYPYRAMQSWRDGLSVDIDVRVPASATWRLEAIHDGAVGPAFAVSARVEGT